MKSTYSRRMKKLGEALEEEGLRGAVLVPGPNMQYFTGANSLLLERPFMLLVPVDGAPHLIAPAFEAGPYARGEVEMKIHPWTDSEGSGRAIADAVRAAKVKGKWGVEGRAPFQYLDRLLKKADPKFRDAEPILQGMRETKDEEEVALLRRSAAILSRAFGRFPGLVREGMTETELGKAATDAIYEEGASKVDDMLVQSGARAADPHGLPTSKKIRRGEEVLFDVGATFEGYYSDVTRTICFGGSRELEDVYAKVLEANQAGIGAAAAGVRVGSVDGAARGVLKKAGLGRYFTHRTGHGLGLEVHEAPYIIEGGKEKLRPNMCFTVEPAVYIPNKLGVRIEDGVLIQGSKGVAMTDTSKEFGWWR